MVSRRCKNTYNWHGSRLELLKVFRRLQRQAFVFWKEDAVENNLYCELEEENSGGSGLPGQDQDCVTEEGSTATRKHRNTTPPVKEKSLGRLSQRFIQLFLVGYKVVSLSTASEKILGCPTTMSSTTSSQQGRTSLDRTGMKTKVRRLYDIANVMISIGVIAKDTGGGNNSSDSAATSSVKNKPRFRWVFDVTPESMAKMTDDAVVALDNAPPAMPQKPGLTAVTAHASSSSSTVKKEDNCTLAALVTPMNAKRKFSDNEEKSDDNSSVSPSIRGKKLFHNESEGVTAAEEQASQDTV